METIWPQRLIHKKVGKIKKLENPPIGGYGKYCLDRTPEYHCGQNGARFKNQERISTTASFPASL